jgi:hypothetical protein
MWSNSGTKRVKQLNPSLLLAIFLIFFSEAKVVFSSKEPEQQGQLLTFTDNLDNSDLYVRVSEFGDWHLATQKHWPKVDFSSASPSNTFIF